MPNSNKAGSISVIFIITSDTAIFSKASQPKNVFTVNKVILNNGAKYAYCREKKKNIRPPRSGMKKKNRSILEDTDQHKRPHMAGRYWRLPLCATQDIAYHPSLPISFSLFITALQLCTQNEASTESLFTRTLGLTSHFLAVERFWDRFFSLPSHCQGFIGF